MRACVHMCAHALFLLLYICFHVTLCMYGGQRATLWAWFFLPIFTSILGLDLIP